ncbi:hypothetical protein E1J61_35670 [Cupriavidus sp. L7L]|nr:hypothetical protein E1J61_35670 [Cupriavidus sp. L7L]
MPAILIPQGLPDDHFKPAILTAPMAAPPKVAAVNADAADRSGSGISGIPTLAVTSACCRASVACSACSLPPT